MGFWDKLFGKKKSNAEESDGQEQYFKDEYKTVRKEDSSASSPVTRKTASVKNTTAQNAKKNEQKPAKKTTPNKVKATPKPTQQNAKSEAKPAKSAEKEAELMDDSPVVKTADTVQESKSTANGKFDIRKAKDGRFFFSLYASNGAVIAYSQIYSSLTAVNTGINSVISNSAKAEIEDTTLKKPTALPCPKWEIYIDKAEQYRFRLYAINGQCVCHSSHGYSSKSGCKGGIDSIRRFAAEARVDKSY